MTLSHNSLLNFSSNMWLHVAPIYLTKISQIYSKLNSHSLSYPLTSSIFTPQNRSVALSCIFAILVESTGLCLHYSPENKLFNFFNSKSIALPPKCLISINPEKLITVSVKQHETVTFKSGFGLFVNIWSWVSHLTSLFLIFPTCKMGQ